MRFLHRAMRCLPIAVCALALASSLTLIGARAQPAGTTGPNYTPDGKLEFPKSYRTWVYLSSGLDMSYLPFATRSSSSFTNVFVNPEAYDAFMKNGVWPDKTVLVLEVRRAEQNGSINRNGHFQAEIVQREAHVKDMARFPGGWAFFGFGDDTPASMIARTESCYSCHQQNGAVDTTFVQFYPTLLPVARAKKTLSPAYGGEDAKGAAGK